MSHKFLRKSSFRDFTCFSLLGLFSFLFLYEKNALAISEHDKMVLRANVNENKSDFSGVKEKEETLTLLQVQARVYRNQGYQAQRLGNLALALSLYQKAVELDPTYAVVHNDLGVIYEAMGDLERAKKHYLQSIAIDPNYLSAYSNLAIFYENRRELKEAAQYWKKRADCGEPDDPWTQKAKSRYEDILLVLGEKIVSDREQEVVDLVKEVSQNKLTLKYDEKALAEEYFRNAKLSYQREKYNEALKQATDAQLLDPTNKQIAEFIEKLQKRLLSR